MWPAFCATTHNVTPNQPHTKKGLDFTSEDLPPTAEIELVISWRQTSKSNVIGTSIQSWCASKQSTHTQSFLLQREINKTRCWLVVLLPSQFSWEYIDIRCVGKWKQFCIQSYRTSSVSEDVHRNNHLRHPWTCVNPLRLSEPRDMCDRAQPIAPAVKSVPNSFLVEVTSHGQRGMGYLHLKRCANLGQINEHMKSCGEMWFILMPSKSLTKRIERQDAQSWQNLCPLAPKVQLFDTFNGLPI